VGVSGGYGVNVCSSHVASIARGVHDFVEVADCELCGVGLKGRKAITEVRGRAVEGDAGEVAHRGDGGAECFADLSFQDVHLGVVEEAEL
jgi:hypothetical protein